MKKLIRIMSCGNVDDGKSTLLGNLFFHKQAYKYKDLYKSNDNLDYSTIFDGLEDEISQKITIDVSYKYFSDSQNNYIFADCPGHVEFTRNMVVAASHADIAILTIDASKNITSQTLKHIEICNLFDIKNIIISINKMDKISYNKTIFTNMKKHISEKIPKCSNVYFIPTSATENINILSNEHEIDWYHGESIWEAISLFEFNNNNNNNSTLSIQYVEKYNDKRYYKAQQLGGIIKIDDELTNINNSMKANIEEIFIKDKKADFSAGDNQITFSLKQNISLSRGDIFTSLKDLYSSDNVKAKIIWFQDIDNFSTNQYIFKFNTKEVFGRILTPISNLTKNNIFDSHISLNESISLSLYSKFKKLGLFVIIDRLSYQTVGCGIITEINNNINSFTFSMPFTVWLTGLSGSGKTTLARKLKKELIPLSEKIILLDGDDIREGINKDLAFNIEDRIENNRRIAEMAKLLNNQGYIVLCSTISPTQKIRNNIKNIISDEKLLEVYLDVDLDTCIARDPKNLYKKNIKNFTGLSSPFEPPNSSDLVIKTDEKNIEDSVSLIYKEIKNKYII